MKKTFNTIDRSICIEKQYNFGVRGIASSWIKQYLAEGNLFVYGDISSDYKTMLCGIPQGSILGHIVFLHYINDPANISNELNFILFADDSNLLYSGKSITEFNNVLNNDLKQTS